ncbi:MAG: hypothetical protein F7C35_06690 [Desulfurococcales archaeon]|nr:hypothetical protein [Desulfurococcales archaeon]
MPRRKTIPPESITLWLRGLPEWKKRALQALASADRPLTTGELLEAIDYQARINTLYNWLTRLERKGLVSSMKVFMMNKRAWKIREEYRKTILETLR